LFSIFASITSHYTHYSFSGPTNGIQRYYKIIYGTLSHNILNQLPYGLLQLPICDRKWPRMAKKQVFLTSAFITLPSTKYAYHGPKNDVQSFLDIILDAPHPHDPTQLTHGPSQPLIHDQNWQKMVDKQVFLKICIHNLPSHTQMHFIGQQQRHTAWGIQGGRRWLQTTRPAGGHP
jgi:hypothetical protein